MGNEDTRTRLTGYIERRAHQLDLTWKEIADRSGVAEMTWRRIRKGTGALTDRAKVKIERALDWADGSVDAILGGGEPTAAAAEPPAAATDGAPAVLSGDPLSWTPHAVCSTLLSYIPAGDEAFFTALDAIVGMRRAALQREMRRDEESKVLS